MKFIKETFFIFIVALFFAGLTAGVNSALRSRIELNQEAGYSRKLLQALQIQLPKDVSAGRIREIEAQKLVKDRIEGRMVYAEIGESGQPVKYAFPISGKGFWGNIYGILAFDRDINEIEGIVFTSHNETPGLGARIEEEWFRKQFRGLEVQDGNKRGKKIVISKADSSKDNQVDAITGATMTSNLLQILLNNEIESILALKDDIRSHQWPSPQKN
jgi:Na+-transporting NADH:ubiquinone oxidoreductase subunit C